MHSKDSRYARDLFIATLVSIPALVFSPTVESATLQLLCTLSLSYIDGRRVRLTPLVLGLLIITTFNLLVPHGQVLAQVGPFRLTDGALRSGLLRALIFEQLIVISRFGIREDIRLPGAFGSLIADSLRCFRYLTERKDKIRPRHLFTDLDTMMLGLETYLENSSPDVCANSPEATGHKPRYYLAYLLPTAMWLIFLAGLMMGSVL